MTIRRVLVVVAVVALAGCMDTGGDPKVREETGGAVGIYVVHVDGYGTCTFARSVVNGYGVALVLVGCRP